MSIIKRSMNLDRTYVSRWGLWEATRELLANFIDAGTYDRDFPTPDVMMLESPSAPTLAQLTVIGNGSKDRSDNNIGQFGEGFKLAALVLCREHEASLQVGTPHGTVTYTLEAPDDMPDVDLLHVLVDTDKCTPEGCIVRVEAPGVAELADQIAPSIAKNMRLRIKPSPSRMCVYVGGIVVKKNGENSLCDYNFNPDEVSLNRDRSTIDSWDMFGAASTLICSQMTKKFALALMGCDEGLFEVRALNHKVFATAVSDCPDKIHAAWREKHGEDALYPSDNDEDNELARRMDGYVPECQKWERYAFSMAGEYDETKSVTAFVASAKKNIALDPKEDWAPHFARVTKLLEFADRPFTLRGFKPQANAVICTIERGGSELWINERLLDAPAPTPVIEAVIAQLSLLNIDHEGGHAHIGNLKKLAAKFAEKLVEQC